MTIRLSLVLLVGFLLSIAPIKAQSVFQQKASDLVDKGLYYYEQERDIKKAAAYFEQAKQLLEQQGDRFSLDYAKILCDLSVCHQELGENSLAISLFDSAGDIVKTYYGKKHPMNGIIAQNKSLFYTSITDYESAIKWCMEAMSCYEWWYGKENERYAQCLQNLGLMYQYINDFQKSKEILLEAIPILERLNSIYCIHAYTNLLTVFSVEKDFESFAAYAQKAESLLKQNHWEDSSLAASLYGSVGYVMVTNGIADGKKYFEYALSLLQKAGGESSVEYFSGLYYYGFSLFLDGSQSDDFIPLLTTAYKQQYLNNVAFYNSTERESFITGRRFSMAKDLLFSSRIEGSQDKQLFDFLLFSKGLLLGTSLNYSKAVYDSGDSEIIEDYKELKELNKYLSGEPSSLKNISSVDAARTKATQLERKITDRLRQTGGYTDGLDYTFSDVISKLKQNEIAIEFVSFLNYKDNTEYYAALIAKRSWDCPKYIQLCKKDEIDKYSSVSPDALYGESAVSSNAYKLIWAPLGQFLSGINTVYFSPAGCLNKLAVEHLFDGEKRFEDRYNCVRVSSSRVLCLKESSCKYKASVLYGGLQYDESEEEMIAESRNYQNSSEQQPNRFRGLDNQSTRKGWSYLPGTLEEVQKISDIISRSKIGCRVYSSTIGNEESLKALSGNDFGILHIATHGFYISDYQAHKSDFFASNPFMGSTSTNEVSPLLRSGLLLSGGNRAWMGEPVPEGVEDGVLTAAEVANLDFTSCDVVVLSACETGLGEITDEGVFGLQRAFKNAGVNTIVMSLWDVDDQATSLMMQTFYRNLVRGKGKRESFSLAQKEVRKKYEEPRYWAAFIMLD